MYSSFGMRRINRAAEPTTPTRSTGTCTILLSANPGADLAIEMPPPPSPSPVRPPTPFTLRFPISRFRSAAASAVHTPEPKTKPKPKPKPMRKRISSNSAVASSSELGSSAGLAIANKRYYNHSRHSLQPSTPKRRFCAAGSGSPSVRRTPLGELSVAEVNARDRTRSRRSYARSSLPADALVGDENTHSTSTSTSTSAPEPEVFEGVGEGILFQPAPSAAAAARGYKGRRNYNNNYRTTSTTPRLPDQLCNVFQDLDLTELMK